MGGTTLPGALDRPVERRPLDAPFRLTVVIPAFREQTTIAATIERVRKELDAVARHGGLEVIVVDDGSGDGTASAARTGGADQVVAFPANRGKGAAVRAGMLAANGATVAFTDADLAYAPAQIERLLETVEAGWDVVVGNRQHPDTTTLVEATALRQWGGRVINLSTRSVLRGTYLDTQCGLKALRADIARVVFGHAQIDGFAFDVELFHLAERYGLALREVPATVENSERSTVHVARDATRLLFDLWRIRRFGGQGVYDLTADERALLAAPSPGE